MAHLQLEHVRGARRSPSVGASAELARGWTTRKRALYSSSSPGDLFFAAGREALFRRELNKFFLPPAHRASHAGDLRETEPHSTRDTTGRFL